MKKLEEFSNTKAQITTKRKAESADEPEKKQKTVTFKSSMVINECLINFFASHEKKRAPSRIFLKQADPKDASKWSAFSKDHPEKEFPPQGTFAYVVHTREIAKKRDYPSQYVAWPIEPGKHNTTFHIGLSEFAPEVIAAGELAFERGTLKFFDKGSGTYNPKDLIQHTAGFPPEKYQALTYTP